MHETSLQDPHYNDWAPMVGVAVGMIQRQCPAAVNAIAACTGGIHRDNDSYRLIWQRRGNQLVIEANGQWHWDKTEDGVLKVQANGSITPLHDPQWVNIMVARDHMAKCAHIAVNFFRGLLPAQAKAA